MKKEKEIKILCKCCDSWLIEDSYIPMIGNPDIYGPGSLRTGSEDSKQILGYHCPYCGIMYNIDFIQKKLNDN